LALPLDHPFDQYHALGGRRRDETATGKTDVLGAAQGKRRDVFSLIASSIDGGAADSFGDQLVA
jgi:hypothetical protein